MTGAKAGACVPVKIFVKWNEVVPIRIPLKQVDRAKHRPTAIRVVEEDSGEPSRDLPGDFPERHHPAGSSRAFDPIAIAEIMVELLQRFDDQEIDGEPDRTAPVGVAAEETCR